MNVEGKGGAPVPVPLSADEDAVGTRFTIRGLFGFFFYSHLNPLFTLGSQRPLVQGDLGTIPPSATSTATIPEWERFWAEELELPEAQRSLMRPMRRALGSAKIFLASIITIVGAGAPFANPLILKALTKYHLGLLDLTLLQKWILVALTLAIPIVTQLMTGYAQGSYNIMSVRIRNMLSYVVYQKLLVLRSSQVESGKILNMLNTDLRQIEMFFELLPALILIPGQLAVSIWLVYVEVGVSIFAGFGYQVCTLPFVVAVILTVTSFFQAKQKLTDKRLKLVNEILNGIRVVKNYVWEEAFKTLIENVRDKEIDMTKHVGLLFSCAEATIRSTSIMLPVIIFYTFMRLGNSLTIDKTFVVISYIGILAGSVAALPHVLQYFFQASVAMGRILTLLNEKPMDVYVNTGAADGDIAICFKNTHLSWNKDVESTTTTQASSSPTTSSLEQQQSEPATAAAVQTKSEGQKEYELVPLPAPGSTVLKEENATKTDNEGNRALHTLIDISFSVKKGQLLAIVGGVGCGKTSCLVSLLSELELTSGSVSVSGTIAYHSQSSWIMNATIQENIIFGALYDEQRLAKAIKQACLETDLTLMPAGVNTEIGEKGINISGGQKARISFARTLYRSSDILLFDDPLSAVDAHVGSSMFASMKEQCSAEGGGRTVVLVTHQVQFLHECDKIVLLEEGRVKMVGTYQEFQSQGINIDSIVTAKEADEDEEEEVEMEQEQDELAAGGEEGVAISELELSGLKQGANPLVARTSRESSRTRTMSSTSSQRERRASSSSVSKKSSRSRTISSENKKAETLPPNTLMTEEEKGEGSVAFDVYSWFIERFTLTIFCIMIFTYLGGSISQASSTYLLTDWSDAIIASYMSTGAPLSLDQNLYWIGTYAWRNAIMVFSVFVATLMMVYGSCAFGKRAHKDLLKAVVAAPISFFDTTPLGRILNRFSQDISEADIGVGFAFMMFTNQCSDLLTGIGMMAYSTNGTILLLVAPLAVIFYFIQAHYRRTNLELKRLNSIANSPVNSSVTTILSGLSSIRAYGVQQIFSKKYAHAVEAESVSFLLQKYCSTWLSSRIACFGACSTFFIFCLTTATTTFIPTGQMAVALVKSFDMPMMLGVLVQSFSILEMGMNCVERIRHYSENVPPEQDVVVPANASTPQLDPNWPTEGSITGIDCVMGYRDGPDILKGLSFSIQGKEKVGIIGRTGSGKSSFIIALFRVENLRKGQLLIDGVDIATVPLQRLRQALTIIPQDAVMFSSTVRFNLDPFSSQTEDTLWSVLETVGMKDAVSNLPLKLDEPVAEGGSNFSAGQRQLICFARALLRKSKIVVLYEATASVDNAADAVLQAMIKEKFAENTVLTIAHRLNTIIDSSRIMVLDSGVLAEMDSASKLLENKDGIFTSLWHQHNKLHEHS